MPFPVATLRLVLFFISCHFVRTRMNYREKRLRIFRGFRKASKPAYIRRYTVAARTVLYPRFVEIYKLVSIINPS